MILKSHLTKLNLYIFVDEDKSLRYHEFLGLFMSEHAFKKLDAEIPWRIKKQKTDQPSSQLISGMK